MPRAANRQRGWSPSPAQQRWGEFQNTLKSGYPMPEPIPPDRLTRLYDELLSIAAQMAAEHDAIFKVITDSHGPWTILKHDLNRLTAMFGAGLASTVTSDPAILRANVDRRLNQLVNADDEGTPSGPEMATTGTESESNGLAGQRRRGMVL